MKSRITLDRLQDALALITVAGLGALCSGSASAIGLSLIGGLSWNAFEQSWGPWRLAHFLGSLLVAPVVLTWIAHREPHAHGAPCPETVGLLAALMFVSVIVFGNRASAPGFQSTVPLPGLSGADLGCRAFWFARRG